MLSRSKILTHTSPIINSYTPKRVIHVGHSYGSVLTIALLSSSPELSDGAVLTGFLYTNQLAGAGPASWGFEYAAENDSRFKDRGSGYIVQATRANVQLSFFKKGSFDDEMLEYAWEVRQPNSVSEFVSLGTVLGQVSGFTGGVLVSIPFLDGVG